MNSFTAPWWLNKRLHGRYYELVHRNTNRSVNRHAAHLSPLTQELICFQSFYGAGKYFGQMYAPIQVHPYKDSVIKGFTPNLTFKSSSNIAGLLATPSTQESIIFPTIAELYFELFKQEHVKESMVLADNILCTTIQILNISVNPQPLPPTISPTAPLIPAI